MSHLPYRLKRLKYAPDKFAKWGRMMGTWLLLLSQIFYCSYFARLVLFPKWETLPNEATHSKSLKFESNLLHDLANFPFGQ